jgi:hypothetical protein
MQQFISKDLIKYVICSYIGYYEILPLVNHIIILEPKRVVTKTDADRTVVIVDGFII